MFCSGNYNVKSRKAWILPTHPYNSSQESSKPKEATGRGGSGICFSAADPATAHLRYRGVGGGVVRQGGDYQRQSRRRTRRNCAEEPEAQPDGYSDRRDE